MAPGTPCVKDADGKLVFGCNRFACPSAANANLIAAAPEMLGLLREFLEEELTPRTDLHGLVEALLKRLETP